MYPRAAFHRVSSIAWDHNLAEVDNKIHLWGFRACVTQAATEYNLGLSLEKPRAVVLMFTAGAFLHILCRGCVASNLRGQVSAVTNNVNIKEKLPNRPFSPPEIPTLTLSSQCAVRRPPGAPRSRPDPNPALAQPNSGQPWPTLADPNPDGTPGKGKPPPPAPTASYDGGGGTARTARAGAPDVCRSRPFCRTARV